MNQPIRIPDNQRSNQPTIQRAINQSINQSTNQPTNQPITNQSMNKPITSRADYQVMKSTQRLQIKISSRRKKKPNQIISAHILFVLRPAELKTFRFCEIIEVKQEYFHMKHFQFPLM